MKILFLTYGPRVVASSRVRVFQYLPFLKKEGIRYKVIIGTTGLACHLIERLRSDNFVERGIKFLLAKFIGKCDGVFSLFQIVRLTLLAIFYDIIFIQKVLIPIFILKFIARVFAKKIVFDFDDAIYVDESYNIQRFNWLLSLSDLIILTNSFARQHVSQFTSSNTLELIGPIHCSRYYPKSKSDNGEVVIGWIGSGSTTKYLLKISKTLERLAVENKNVAVELIGASRIPFESSQVRLKRWRLDTEVGNLQNFDIGIMPLSDDEWTRGKGGYKVLQYMAVGIPCVASPVGINKELIKDGKNGFLATTEDEWYERLSLLIENPELRKRMGTRGREFVIKSYSFEVATPKLISALKQLI